MKKLLMIMLALTLALTTLVGCGGGKEEAPAADNQSEVQKIIAEAQTMTLEELAAKAIEESNGKTFYGVGNSSRGKSALPLFIEYLQSIDSSYKLDFEWQQPKNNKIFEYNCVNPDKTYDNCWDFVAEGEHGLFMDIDSEIVGKNFLYMLTKDEYATYLKDAFDKLSAAEQAYFQPTVDAMAKDAEELGLGENGKYALAWIKLWVNSYNAVTDDGPICNTLVDASAVDKFGLLVYSKVRSVEETDTVSVNNIKVAAYQPGYEGIGGYAYCHYLFVTDNSPLPWTACAFIAYMTETVDGFSAWGKDLGGYSSNPVVAQGTEEKYHHSEGLSAKVACETTMDKGYDWWVNDGKLVVEDPVYCASVAFTVGSWIEMLDKYTPE